MRGTFHGKPCRKCGSTLRRTDNGICVECGRERYNEYRRKRERALAAEGWRWVPDPNHAHWKRRVFEPESDLPEPESLLERKEVRSVRELMEAAALADAGIPQSLIVRGPLSDDDDDKTR